MCTTTTHIQTDTDTHDMQLENIFFNFFSLRMISVQNVRRNKMLTGDMMVVADAKTKWSRLLLRNSNSFTQAHLKQQPPPPFFSVEKRAHTTFSSENWQCGKTGVKKLP